MLTGVMPSRLNAGIVVVESRLFHQDAESSRLRVSLGL